MRICVFEDAEIDALEPLTLTRPAFDLWCGSTPMLARQRRYFGAREVGALVREEIVPVCRRDHPGMPLNDLTWLRKGPTVLVNARWLPGAEAPADFLSPRVALVEGQVAYMVLGPAEPGRNGARSANGCKPYVSLSSLIRHYQETLPRVAADGAMIDYPWDLVECNAQALCEDWSWRRAQDECRAPANLAVVGPPQRAQVHAGARIEPYVVADCTRGPVFVDEGATVQSFTRLEGPCYVGRSTTVAAGAKIRGSTIGPDCRVGGEVEASIVHGHSNKCHDGFLGHSYVGAWVNLGAGTQVSDLRNDYRPVRVPLNGARVDTGLVKVGAFIGDHTKTGLDSLLNSGAVIGAFCQLLPTGSLLPSWIPSFCRIRDGQIREFDDVLGILRTAAAVVQRRGQGWDDSQSQFVMSLYDRTAWQRRQAIAERDPRPLRESLC